MLPDHIGPTEPADSAGPAATAAGLCLLEIDYTSSGERIDELLPDHRAWLEEHYRRGNFLLSGPKRPRSGGVILARDPGVGALEEIAAQDPFVRGGAAVSRVIPFTATMATADVTQRPDVLTTPPTTPAGP